MKGETSRLTKTTQFGIVGGGQLAQMLAFAAQDLNTSLAVAHNSASNPAAFSPAKNIYCTMDEEDKFKDFLSQCEFITFENEFVDCHRLTELLQSIDPDKRPHVFPSVAVLQKLRDKVEQKKILSFLQIPSGRWEFFDTSKHADSMSWRKNLAEVFGEQCVLKWSCFGYDGKGTFFLNSKTHQSDFESFIHEGQKKGAQIFAEEHIHFEQELAQSMARSLGNQKLFFPLVTSRQVEGICNEVKGPAGNFYISQKIIGECQNAISKIADHLNYEGLLSVEFFINKNQQLFVNEIAPRVHNTAHYSQDVCQISQFSAHLRAALENLPPAIDSVLAFPFFGMINILGPKNLEFERSHLIPHVGSQENIFVHWYGKAKIAPRRKLGHINFCAENHTAFEQQQKRATEILQKIFASLFFEAENLRKAPL